HAHARAWWNMGTFRRGRHVSGLHHEAHAGGAGDRGGSWREYALAVARLRQVLVVHPVAHVVGVGGGLKLRDAEPCFGFVLATAASDQPLSGSSLEVSVGELPHGRARAGGLGKEQALADEVYRVAPVELALDHKAGDIGAGEQARLQRSRGDLAAAAAADDGYASQRTRSRKHRSLDTGLPSQLTALHSLAWRAYLNATTTPRREAGRGCARVERLT